MVGENDCGGLGVGTQMPPLLIVGNIGLSLDMQLDWSGFERTLVDTGSDAARQIAQRFYGAAIVAAQLPDMTGVDFARNLLAQAPNTKVLVLGANVSEADSAALIATGQVFFIPCSASGSQLVDMIKRLQIPLTPTAASAPASAGSESLPPLSASPCPVSPLPTSDRSLAESEELRARCVQQEAVLRQQSETLRQQSETLRQQSETLQQQSETLQQQSDCLLQAETAHRSLREQQAALQAQVTSAQHAAAQREAAQAAEQRIADLEQSLAKSSGEIESLRTRIFGLEELLGEGRRERQSLETERTAARAEAEELRARVAELTTQKARLESELAAACSDRDEARDAAQVSALGQERHALVAQVAEAQTERDGLARRIVDLLLESERLTGKLEVTAGERDLSTARVAELEAERDRLQAAIEQLKVQLQDAKGEAIDIEIVDEEEILGEVRKRTATAAGLVRAIHPFMYGLKQAIDHIELIGEESSMVHLKQLQLLHAMLERMSKEVDVSAVTGA